MSMRSVCYPIMCSLALASCVDAGDATDPLNSTQSAWVEGDDTLECIGSPVEGGVIVVPDPKDPTDPGPKIVRALACTHEIEGDVVVIPTPDPKDTGPKAMAHDGAEGSTVVISGTDPKDDGPKFGPSATGRR